MLGFGEAVRLEDAAHGEEGVVVLLSAAVVRYHTAFARPPPL